MAVVVKEASKTPLAIAALADNMAKTYLQYAQNETAQAQWEQEATWRNQDREYENQQREKLGQLASNVSSMDPSSFLNSAAQESAAYAAGQGQDWTDYLKSTGEDTSLSAHYLEKQDTEAFIRRQMKLDPPDPISDASFISRYARPKQTRDGTGMEINNINPISGAITGGIDQSGANNAWSEMLKIPTFPSEAEALEARDRGELQAGQIIYVNGQAVYVNQF